MVEAIQQGTGFKGFKVTRGNKVELDYDYFKDSFGSKGEFAHFFRNVLSSATPLQDKVREVRQALSQMSTTLKKSSRAFKNALGIYTLEHVPSMRYANRPAMFRNLQAQVMDILKSLDRPYLAKWSLGFKIEFKKWDSEEHTELWITPTSIMSISKETAYKGYEEVQRALEARIEALDPTHGSGWYPRQVLEARLKIYQYNPVKGRGRSYFEITGYTNAKCGLVNVKNEDNRCFIWAMVSSIHPTNTHSSDPKRYQKHFDKYWAQVPEICQGVMDEDGMEDQSFAEMERVFKRKIVVLEMTMENEEWGDPVPLFPGVASYKETTHLLKAVKIDEYGDPYSHFVWIKNMDHFLSRHINTRASKTQIKSFCANCFRIYPRSQTHSCEEPYKTIVATPKGTSDDPLTLKFRGDRRTIEVPLFIAADFEAYQQPRESAKGQHSMRVSQQEACSWAYLPIPTVMNEDGAQFVPDEMQTYCGPDAATEFLDSIVQYCEDHFVKYMKNHQRMRKLTPDEEKEYEEADTCCLCGKPGNWEREVPQYTKKGVRYQPERDNVKVRHHNHFNGRFVGAAHSSCNLKGSQWPKLAVGFHNLKGYDSHFLIRAYQEWHGRIQVLADNTEKIKSFSLHRFWRSPYDSDTKYRYTIRFFDTFAFLSTSLASLTDLAISFDEDAHDQQGHGLVHNLPLTSKFLDEVLPCEGVEKALLKQRCLRKGVFPYEWLDSLDKMDFSLFDEEDVFQLQPEDFHSKLSMKSSQGLTEKCRWAEMMSRAMLWDTFQEYHDFYLQMDVYLLADLFQRFRKTCLHAVNCGLDPCHYYGNPSLTMDSYLARHTVEVNLLDNKDHYLRYRKEGMRGGISYWRRYFTKANNELHPEYDRYQERSEILDMDATSLYPWAARQRLPTGGFVHTVEMMEGEKMWDYIDQLLFHWPEDRGAYLWVDIELPVWMEEWQARVPAQYQQHASIIKTKFGSNLHDYQANYPILVENKVVTTEQLSERQKAMYDRMNGHHPTSKLINDLYPKKKYMIHYLTLRMALERGWVVTQIHERLEFQQLFCVKEFLDECVKLRAMAKNPVEKTLQKTNMNSLIGKFIEDVMKHSDFRLWSKLHAFHLNERKGRLKDNWFIIHEDLVMGEVIKSKTRLNKPILLGIAVYDISKILMSSLWYFLQDHYGPKIELCGTDTDSLIFWVKTASWQKDAEYFNQFSLFPENHPFYHNSRFSPEKTEELIKKGINPYVGMFDLGEKYLKSIPGYFKPDHDKIIEAAAMRAKMYSFQRAEKEKFWVSSRPGKWLYRSLEELDVYDWLWSEDRVYWTKDPDFTSHVSICKAKGVPSGKVAEQYRHETYRAIVLDPEDHLDETVTFYSLKSEQHKVFLLKQQKASLRPIDDKRWSDNPVSSLPYGHYRTLVL